MHRALKARPVRLVRKGLKALLVPMALTALMEQPVHKGLLAHRAQPVQMVLMALQARREQLAHRVLKVHPAPLVPKEQQARKVLKV